MAKSKLEILKEAARKNQAELEKLEEERVLKAREFEDKDVIDEEDVSKTSGRMGLVSPESRQAVRKRVAEQDTFDQLFTESSPSIGGALVGGAVGGAVGGPVGAGVGAVFGGIGGELAGQETGISPQSDSAMILSGASIAGVPAGAAFNAALRRGSTLLRNLPPIKAATARLTMEMAAGEFESIGTQIMSKRTGIRAEDAYVMYAAAKSFAGADIPIENFKTTLDEVRRQVDIYMEFPGMEKTALKTEKALQKVLATDTKSLGMDDVMKLYKATNELASEASMNPSASKVADDVFKMFDKDIDMIVDGGGKTGKAAMATQAAFKRSKLDRAVQTLERGAAQFSKQAEDAEDALLDVVEMRKWLANKTNPRHADFDKNLTEELSVELPDIKRNLGLMAQDARYGISPGGPNSLVLRGIGASTGRAIVGSLIAGPVGAGIGAMSGSRYPELLTGMLLSGKGRNLMTAMNKAGKGTINYSRWIQLTNIAAQAAKPAGAEFEGLLDNMQQQPGP